MKFFWPHRSDAKGFVIESLSPESREKSSKVLSHEILNQSLDQNNLKSTKEECKNLPPSNLSIKKGHWANRDFLEYRKIA